jgi:carbon storage regulator
MLVLNRKQGQGVNIDDQIKVRILSVNGNRVRIGIEAPQDVRIHREEIYKAIQLRGDLDALAVTPSDVTVPAS